MSRKNYKVAEVIKSFRNKKDISIDAPDIFILKDIVFDVKAKKYILNSIKSHDLGNGSWGKIDFLRKVANYRVHYVAQFDIPHYGK